MLTAKTDTGKFVSLLQLSRAEALRCKKDSFVCPVCGEPVQLKTGQIRIPHFAHLVQGQCVESLEIETQEHLALKKELAQWCADSGLSYQLEVYLPEVKQRPDLLVGKLAVEIQCSPLKLSSMAKRSKNYLAHGYQPVWICGSRVWGANRLKASSKQYCNYSRELGFHLWAADWEARRLSLYYHIEEGQDRQLYYGCRSWAFGTNSLGFILEKGFQSNLYHSRKYRVKLEMLRYYQSIRKKLLVRDHRFMKDQAYLYQRRLHALELRPWFYYPVNQSFILKDSILMLRHQIWVWLQEKQGRHITRLALYKRAYQLIVSQDLLFDFPLVYTADAVEWYVHHLIQGLLLFGLVQRSGRGGDLLRVSPCIQTPAAKGRSWVKNSGLPRAIKTGTPIKV